MSDRIQGTSGVAAPGGYAEDRGAGRRQAANAAMGGLRAVASMLPGGAQMTSMVGSGVPGVAAGADGVEQMRAMQAEGAAMQLQYMSLQQSVQDDNRRFSTMSNVMRANHDTLKSAIQNVRS